MMSTFRQVQAWMSEGPGPMTTHPLHKGPKRLIDLRPFLQNHVAILEGEESSKKRWIRSSQHAHRTEWMTGTDLYMTIFAHFVVFIYMFVRVYMY